MAPRKDKVAASSRATDGAGNADHQIMDEAPQQDPIDTQNPSDLITRTDFERMMKELQDSWQS